MILSTSLVIFFVIIYFYHYFTGKYKYDSTSYLATLMFWGMLLLLNTINLYAKIIIERIMQ
jgi:hypothetical protein